MEAVMDQTPEIKQKKKGKFISKPLFMQTLKANWLLWVLLTVGSAALFFIINVVVNSRNLFSNVNMDSVSVYVADENLNWLSILGLLEQMNFNLTRIEVMSRIDLNSILGELTYKIAGVLLPMIYVMIVSNSLIAAQVSSGSLAYVLSTPTSRKTVLRTNYLFLITSLFAMYAVITGTALISETIAGAIRIANGGASNMLPVRTVLLCLASFCAMFALSGICFGASAFFNKSTRSIAVGGGACVICFLCCILGLFGSKVFVSVGIGVQAMNVFNYMTLFTFIDTDSISSFAKAIAGVQDAVISYNWLWEMGILVGVGVVTTLIGAIRFLKKDLPL